MPRILDNIEKQLLPALCDALNVAERADFCVGYFNLRGWRQFDEAVDKLAGGEGKCCRLLVGMQHPPHEELKVALSLLRQDDMMDQGTALRLKKEMAEKFREQLTFGIPTNEDEAALRRLAAQIKAKKVVVKLFLRYALHAKLYLCFRQDAVSPAIGFVGSSNLTLAGLAKQGELNVDVLDGDACQKLAGWFEDRWADRFCVDISRELVEIIESSWAREAAIPPYYIYLKMAYHLSQEARTGLCEFRIPRDMESKLLDYQKAAVQIAAHHLNKRGGVLIGDVVGLGKTLMATAVARIFDDDFKLETLIICPKNLVSMWRDYRIEYGLNAHVLSLSDATKELRALRRFRLVIIDESHNLRNREGKRFKAIQEYIQGNESKVILLSATPYNKTFLDLSSQLRLFVPEDADIGIRPEQLIREIGEPEFIRRHQCPVRSLAAFDKSEHADDWRELMRLYLVRRTRSFIQENYACVECPNCQTVVDADHDACPKCGRAKRPSDRRFLLLGDATRSPFPTRVPRTVTFRINDQDPSDQYACLYSAKVVDTINHLVLPRYGLGNYVDLAPAEPPTAADKKQIENLSRAGHRLKGFCRTNLFKRLESSGFCFLKSVERHILRNYVYLHALRSGQPLPIGTLDLDMFDSRFSDADAESGLFAAQEDDGNGDEERGEPDNGGPLVTARDFEKRAVEVYADYSRQYARRFKWLRPDLFVKELAEDLESDARDLLRVLEMAGAWDASRDAKLKALVELLSKQYPAEKVLVFTQFADTVHYLTDQLRAAGVRGAEAVTGDSSDPTTLAYRFSPVSNHKRAAVPPEKELRVLVCTDVLSEGQNLQDCNVVVNFDLPWAIIRLIQRAGRVDRIGQAHEQIFCHSFLPAEGVERIIKLRSRVLQRLRENAEVVGADETYFEEETTSGLVLDLYHEKAGILDGDDDTEVDLASYAFQIWKNGVAKDERLAQIIPELPPVVYSARSHSPAPKAPAGVLVYARTAEGSDALTWVDSQGRPVTESQYAILRAAECPPDAPAVPRAANHHELVRKGVLRIVEEERSAGGQLGRPSGARFRTYARLSKFAQDLKGTVFERPELSKALDTIYRFPLRQAAVDTLNRQLRSGISDEELAELVTTLWQEERLCIIEQEEEHREPLLICSMGLVGKGKG